MTTIPMSRSPHWGNFAVLDREPGSDELRTHVLSALASEPRILSPKFFYDAEGAQLFDDICALDEYYLTRTEAAIHARYMSEITALIGERARIVEFGSGTGAKTLRLLQNCQQPAAYVPVDIARQQLLQLADRTAQLIQGIEVYPVWADFALQPQHRHPGEGRPQLLLPTDATQNGLGRTVAFYHGSTIGNFHPVEAQSFLERLRDICGRDGGLLIGVDLVKNPEIINRAYNDAAGVTARFNKNILKRINRECRANFDLNAFEHRAFFDEQQSRIEMQLVSTRDQVVEIPADSAEAVGGRFHFARGAHITTEYSYKYSEDAFEQLALCAGWTAEHFWTDDKRWFGVWLLRRS